jgi:hypothetical protein
MLAKRPAAIGYTAMLIALHQIASHHFRGSHEIPLPRDWRTVVEGKTTPSCHQLQGGVHGI